MKQYMPQGTSLGSLQSVIYVSNLSVSATPHIEVLQYADYTVANIQ